MGQRAGEMRGRERGREIGGRDRERTGEMGERGEG